ncbi:MAG: DMT family transporter [Xanthomonadales bacterium]|nr:DMT family transporter [Xanthomonadales bacterium]
MIETVMTITIGLIGGLAVGTQGPIAGAMSQRVGGAASSLVVHVGGALASLALLILRRGEQVAEWRTLPWYMLACGGFGLVLYLSISHTIPRLGATSALTLIIVGQVIAGVVIDSVGAFGIPVREIDLARIAGVVLLVSGAWLVVR